MRVILRILVFICLLYGCSPEMEDGRISELEWKAIQASWNNTSLDSSMFYLDEALQIDPLAISIYSRKVEFYIDAEKCDEALRTIESMPIELKELPQALILTGEVYEQFGRINEATNLYKHALSIYDVPEHHGEDDIMQMMAYWYLQTAAGDKEQALESIEIIEAKDLTKIERGYIDPFVSRIRSYKGKGYLELLNKQKTCYHNRL